MSEPTNIEEPWFRQFWPWLLIALPTSAVLGCAITITLAVVLPDRVIEHPAQPVNEVLGHNSVVPPKE